MITKRQRTFWRLERIKDGEIVMVEEHKTKKAATEKAWYAVDTGRADFAHISKMREYGEQQDELEQGKNGEYLSGRFLIHWDAPEQIGGVEVIEPLNALAEGLE